MATLEQAFSEAQKNQRVCPQPRKWQELYALLPDKRRVGAGLEAALPLTQNNWPEFGCSNPGLRGDVAAQATAALTVATPYQTP